MSLGKIYSNAVISISENGTIHECAKLMKEKHVGTVLVLSEQGDKKPLGIITDRDIVVKIVSKKNDLSNIKVTEVMSTDLLLLPKQQGIKEAIEAMKSKGVRRVPILDDDKKVCGIVSVDDLIMLLVNELSSLSGLIKDQLSPDNQ